MDDKIKLAAQLIQNSKHTTAFTGAGVSVESGIPPFRGENGLWNKYDPVFLDINFFLQNPKKSWVLIKEIFYDYFGKAKPNTAHKTLAEMEKLNYLQTVITQNIDNLHQEAGSKKVYEYHGTSKNLICMDCNTNILSSKLDLNKLPPKCSQCGGLLKPDFIFFGEPIPELAQTKSILESKNSDVFIIIGTTGEIMPASMVPYLAKENNAKIIEINISKSNYTDSITDVFLQGKATHIMSDLLKELKQVSN